MLDNIIKIFKSKRSKYAIVILLLLLITIIFTKNKAPIANQAQKEIVVSTKTIIPKEKTIYLSAYGLTTANSEIALKTSFPGRLIKKHYQKGSFVIEGTDLFSFVSLEYSTIIEKAQLNLTKLEQEHLKLIQDPKTTPNKRALSEKSIILAKQKLTHVSSYTNIASIRAPFTGKINDIFIEEGDIVKSGDIIARIIQVNPTKVQINIPEKFINDIKLNDQIYLEILNKQKLVAIINYISASIDVTTRTFAIEALIKDEGFPVGATVSAEIPLKKLLA